MSERERWVVYPLLFLTLGVALRDKLLKRVDTGNVLAQNVVSASNLAKTVMADEVVCRRLIVKSRDARRNIAVIQEEPTSRGGRVITFDARQRPSASIGGPAQVRILPGWLWPGKVKPSRPPNQPGPATAPPKPAPPVKASAADVLDVKTSNNVSSDNTVSPSAK